MIKMQVYAYVKIVIVIMMWKHLNNTLQNFDVYYVAKMTFLVLFE